jgi:hypothetical protein
VEKDPAVWSRHFARSIGGVVGCPTPEATSADPALRQEAETILGEMTEDLRHLPVGQWGRVERLACFLAAEQPAPDAVLDRLREIRSYVAFLRNSYGLDRPADESDAWSDEDRRDVQAAALRRAEAEDPYPWPGERDDARAG